MPTPKSLTRRQFLTGALMGAGLAAAPAILAACGASTTTAPATDAPAAPAAEAPAPAATSAPAAPGTTEVIWWDNWVTQAPWIENEIALFQQANPTIAVTRVQQPGQQFADMLKAAYTDKSMPDIFPTGGVSQDTRVLFAEGWFKPLNEFSDYQDFVKTFPNPKIDFVSGKNILEGQTVSAPFEARGGMWNLLYLNTQVYKEAGLVDGAGEAKVPATLDELYEQMRAVGEFGGGSVYGFASPFSEFLGAFFPWFWGERSGAAFDGTDLRTGKSTYGQNPVYTRILEFVAKGRDEGWIHPQSASANDEAIRALFAEGEIAVIPGGVWNLNGWQQSHPDFTSYKPFAPPLIDTPEQKGWYYVDPGGQMWSISSQARQPDAAWEFYKWLHSKEAGRRWVESGNGASIFPENNDPQAMGTPAQQEFYVIQTENTRVGPYRPNPDMDKVKFGDTKPNETAILQGVFTGQITDLDAALRELGAAKDAMREQAFADAKAAGAQNVGFEYLAKQVQFPDFDPAAGKDYIPEGV